MTQASEEEITEDHVEVTLHANYGLGVIVVLAAWITGRFVVTVSSSA